MTMRRMIAPRGDLQFRRACCTTHAGVDIVWRILATLGLVALNGFFWRRVRRGRGTRLAPGTGSPEEPARAPFAGDQAQARPVPVHLPARHHHRQPGPGRRHRAGRLRHRQPPPPRPGAPRPPTTASPSSLPWHQHLAARGCGRGGAQELGHPQPRPPAAVVAGPLVAFTYIFYPAIWLLNSASNALLRMSGVHIHDNTHGGLPHTADECARSSPNPSAWARSPRR